MRTNIISHGSKYYEAYYISSLPMRCLISHIGESKTDKGICILYPIKIKVVMNHDQLSNTVGINTISSEQREDTSEITQKC